jgi:hypothetical protein
VATADVLEGTRRRRGGIRGVRIGHATRRFSERRSSRLCDSARAVGFRRRRRRAVASSRRRNRDRLRGKKLVGARRRPAVGPHRRTDARHVAAPLSRPCSQTRQMHEIHNVRPARTREFRKKGPALCAGSVYRNRGVSRLAERR